MIMYILCEKTVHFLAKINHTFLWLTECLYLILLRRDKGYETFCLIRQELLKCSRTVKSEKKLQSCLKLRKSQNPFCHILEILNKKLWKQKL